MQRKNVPLTIQYSSRSVAPTRTFAEGLSCPEPCDGTCKVVSILLCVYGLTDTPWVILAERERDDGEWKETLCAAALSIKFGLDTGRVLSEVCSRARVMLSERLGPSWTETASLREVMATLLTRSSVEGCVVTNFRPSSLTSVQKDVQNHRPWAGVYTTAPGSRHSAAYICAAPTEVRQQGAIMTLDVTKEEQCAVPPKETWSAMDSGESMMFFYTTNLYKYAK